MNAESFVQKPACDFPKKPAGTAGTGERGKGNRQAKRSIIDSPTIFSATFSLLTS